MMIEAKLSFKHGLIMQILKKHNLTLKKVAKLAGWHQATLGNFVRFQSVPTIKKKKLLNALKKFEPDLKYQDLFPIELPKARELFGRNEKVTKEMPLDRMVSFNELKHLPDGTAMNEIDAFIEKEDQEKFLKKAFNNISDREQLVVMMFYGIGFDRQYTLLEIGNEINLTKDRVRQIRNKALKRMSRLERW